MPSHHHHVKNVRFIASKALIMLSMLIPEAALAQNPFSTDFMLAPYQVESSTQINYLNSKYSIDSLIFKNADESRFVNYTQGFTVGLPYDFSVGISETYADPLHKNPLNPGEGKSGFKAPFFNLNKLMNYSDGLKFKAGISLKPNLTESKDDFNTLQASILAVAKVKSDLDLSVGYTKTRYELSNTDADIFTVIVSKKFNDDTLLNLSYEHTKWSPTKTTLGEFDSSTGHAVTAELSRSIAREIWIGLNATYYYNQCTFTPIFPPIEYTNITDLYTAGVTIKWLF
jgi:hypothetical protein